MKQLPQPVSPLLSLKVNRTANEIANMETESQTMNINQIKTDFKNQEILNNKKEEEIQQIKDLLEHQCYTFVVFKNQITDSRKSMKKMMNKFQDKMQSIEKTLNNFSAAAFQQINEFNRQIDNISQTLSLKPILHTMLFLPDVDRITGIDSNDNLVAITSSNGKIGIINIDSLPSHQLPATRSHCFYRDFL